MNRTLMVSTLVIMVSTTYLYAEESLPLKSVNKANKVIDAALVAHGGAENHSAISSIEQQSKFTNYAVNQSRLPNPPWDKSESAGFSAVDFEKNIFVTRNSGAGSGFDFNNATVINGADSWQLNFRNGTAAPIAQPDFNTSSGPFVRVTAPLLMKQLQSRRQSSHWLGVEQYNGRPHDVVTLVMEVGPGLSLYFDQETSMLTRMERVLPPFGQVEYRFEDYEMVAGVAVNNSFHLLINGDANIDIANSNTRINQPIDSYAVIPDHLNKIAAVTPDNFNIKEIDEGVFLVGGAGTYGLFIEMQDHIVAIGGTLGVAARLEEVRKHIADKPLRYGVLTHHHSDHIPGAADYASEGATIITFEPNKDLVLAATGDENAKLEFIEDGMTLSDGNRVIELIDIGPTPHTEQMLIVYLPEEKIIFEADHFGVPRTGPIPAASETTQAFAKALDHLGLDFDKIVGAHSPRVGSPDDLKTAIKTRPAVLASAH